MQKFPSCFQSVSLLYKFRFLEDCLAVLKFWPEQHMLSKYIYHILAYRYRLDLGDYTDELSNISS